MRIKIKNALLAMNILPAVLSLIISCSPTQAPRIILGLPFILFFPGYTLIAALFPKKSNLDPIERVALSFGLSVAVAPLIGLILTYTPWEMRPHPFLLSLTFLIVAIPVITWYGQRRLSANEKPSTTLNLSLHQAGEL